MCLLIVMFDVDGVPLTIGANRDELLARPAVPMGVLAEKSPRILGGRDLLAGGTWLAVNEHGVLAGLTNLPQQGQRDSAKRSRGELPLALAGFTSSREAVTHFEKSYSPKNYNGSWLMVGDRKSLFYVDMATGNRPAVTELKSGIHVLENRPYGAPSQKADHVTKQLLQLMTTENRESALKKVLASHEAPPNLLPDTLRPVEVESACVHAGIYGTRSSCIIDIDHEKPRVQFTDGSPCTAVWEDAARFWTQS